MAPVVHGLEAEYSGQVDFSYLDVDDAANDDFKSRLGYQVQPHIFLLDGDGAVVGEWQGRVGEAELAQVIDALLAQ
jgi:thioredoxin-like negative regulator of GroEL